MEKKTLKNIIQGKESNVSWTGELEGDRLYFDVYRDADHVSYEVPLTPAVVNVAGGQGKGIYPQLIGFGSLDISGMPDDIKVFVNDFAKAFSKNIFNGPEIFFDSKYFFNYVFFRNDFVQDWKKFFGVDFPISNDNIDGNSGNGRSSGNDVNDGNDGKADSDIKECNIFTKWVIGQPVMTTEILQQPIRFYCNPECFKKDICNQAYVDFVLHIRLDNKKIYQISRGVFGR